MNGSSMYINAGGEVSPPASGSHNAFCLDGGSGGGQLPVQSQIAMFNGVDQYMTTSTPIVLAGDCEFGFTIRVNRFDNYRGIMYDSGGGSAHARMSNNNDIQLALFFGVYILIPNCAFPDNLGRKIVIKRIGTNAYVSVDGVELPRFGAGATDVVIDTFGRNSSGHSNVAIYDIYANDRSVHDYSCKDGFENNPVAVNKGNGGNGSFSGMSESDWINE